MSLTIILAARIVNPGPVIQAADPYLVSEAWWDGFTQGSDGLELSVPADLDARLVESWKAGHWSGWDNFETDQLVVAAAVATAEEEAEWLGYQLGADGVEAELCTPHDDERAAFARGHDAGDDYLWRVDPAYASHLKERATRVAFDGTIGDWHEAEVAESGAGYRLVRIEA